MGRDKLTCQVNVSFSIPQHDRIHELIRTSAPDMDPPELLRLAFLYLDRRAQEHGLLRIIAEILGA